ncbi:MAG: DUF6134 family protein [Xanthomonadales bacterium]|jgi:hypothetical protein|nr:DUF6134 family protein [Xanthomonadales bacterium]
MPNRIKDIYALFAALALLAILFLSPNAEASEPPGLSAGGDAGAWRFRVFLDDREIGYHHFYLAGTGEHRQLRSEASFEYRLLFVKLFHYEHENLETWSGNCLSSIRSKTDANGRAFKVNGKAGDGTFLVTGNDGLTSLPDCVMSFAYWNPAFLEQERLLNTQDGSFLDVEVSPPVPEELVVRGESQPSLRYRLAAGDLNLDLWYSDENEWLALESEVSGGRKLRYEPM